jgi:NhaA family Na+:H+ antiporter
MATDIAFALGILTLLGPSVPPPLKIFLTALAIADDVGAVMVIAVFYTEQISIGPLLAAGLCLALLGIAARKRIDSVALYGVLAIGVWLGVLASGIHATVAGILVATVVPVRAHLKPKRFFATARQKLAELEASNLTGDTAKLDPEQMEALEELHKATSDVVPAGHAFEHYLHPVTAYVILPLFALFNAGVVLGAGVLGAIANPLGLGIVLGLVVGKQAGITLATWVVIRTGLADLPENISWRQIHGVATLAGIGFTMALFVADLALADEQALASAKMGILAASAICAVLGYALLRSSLPTTHEGHPRVLGGAAGGSAR